MDRILRADPGWDDALARALASVPRPVEVDARFTPRASAVSTPSADAGLRVRPRTYDRARMPPARSAATLLLVYPGEDGTLTTPLTVRHAGLRDHAGEVSLPGGSVEAEDTSPQAAALREAWEEIGVDAGSVRIIGQLDDIWIPVSNFELRPFVGAAAFRPELRPHTDEVAAIVELPLTLLVDDEAITEELIEGRGWRLQAAVYRYGGERIWGATARTLAMFAAVLRHALREAPNRSDDQRLE
jgi:8-oxo-dGTP pyrophosphatase MutT (NUDIX family)